MTINEAKAFLELLESLPDNPDKVFTELYKKRSKDCIDDYNFMLQIYADGNEQAACLPKKVVFALPTFSDCVLSYERANDWRIGISNDIYESHCDIMRIDLAAHTYVRTNDIKNDIAKELSRDYKNELKPVPEHVALCENFTFKNRRKFALLELKKPDSSAIKAMALCLKKFLFLSRKTAEDFYREKKKAIEDENRRMNERFLEKQKIQNGLRKKSDKIIKKIENKQNEIAMYLNKLGYVETH